LRQREPFADLWLYRVEQPPPEPEEELAIVQEGSNPA
jgi:hypothetical protein